MNPNLEQFGIIFSVRVGRCGHGGSIQNVFDNFICLEVEKMD